SPLSLVRCSAWPSFSSSSNRLTICSSLRSCTEIERTDPALDSQSGVEEMNTPRAAGTLIDSPDITPEALQLAVRNHSMPLEALRDPVTPEGVHDLLTHS